MRGGGHGKEMVWGRGGIWKECCGGVASGRGSEAAGRGGVGMETATHLLIFLH